MVVGGLEQFSVSPRPLGFGFGTLGLRVWGQGLTKNCLKSIDMKKDDDEVENDESDEGDYL